MDSFPEMTSSGKVSLVLHENMQTSYRWRKLDAHMCRDRLVISTSAMPELPSSTATI